MFIHTAIQCYQLDPLKNGTVVYSGSNYSFGDTATYSCDIGFGLSGNTERICGGNGSSPKGEWSGTDPSCEGMDLNLVTILSVTYQPMFSLLG